MEKSDAPSAQAPGGLRPSAQIRRWSRRASLRGAAVGAAGLAALGTCGVFHETHALEVVRVAIPLPRLPTPFHGMTIAQLSDIHFGPLVDPALIRHAVDVTLSLEPDLIVLTGDYVSRRTDEEPRLIVDILGRLVAPEGVWAVLGNHDIYNWDKPTVAALEAAKIRVLRNANTALRRSGDRLWLAGVDDVTKNKHDLARALAGINPDEAVIALVHEPDFADTVALDPRVCLQLSGHSHGGQVCFPLVGPLRLPRLARKYPRGLYQVGGLWLYTNRGLGVMGARVRLNCRPEITLFTLTAEDPGEPGVIESSDPDTINNLAMACFRQGKFADAERCWRELLRLLPDHPDVHNSLGIALAEQDKLELAVEQFQRAVRFRPDFPEAHSNLALALVGLGRFEEAEASAGQSWRLRPGYVDAANHLGLALLKQGRLDEAMEWFDVALQARADHPEVHKNRAICWLLQGDYARGWPEFEWRWRCKDFVPRRFPRPPWDGSPLNGLTILLHTEQGLGDTLQFLRYALLLKQRGGTVLLECPRAMHRLLARSRGIDQLVPKGGPLPAFDVHAALVSLPSLFGTTLQTVPADIPYVFAEPELVEEWRQELASVSEFKIGISWRGSPRYRADRQRSIPLRCFAPLARTPGVKLFSLQKGLGIEELGSLAGQLSVTDLSPRMDESTDAFLHTAAVMKNLDLVVTCDTAIGHLAGALAVPVWIALPFVPDWRWQMGREDSPWYPTARLFRQRKSGEWTDVFERMAREVAKFPFAAGTGKP